MSKKQKPRVFDFSEFDKSGLNQKCATVAFYTFSVLVAAVLFGMLVFNFLKLTSMLAALLRTFSVVFYGFFIACILFPFFKIFNRLLCFIDKLRKKDRLREALALVSTYVFLIIIVCILLIAILPYIGEELASFTSALSASLENARNLIEKSESLSSFVSVFDSTADLLYRTVISPSAIFSYLSGFLSGTYNVLFGAILSVYILMSRRRLCAIIAKMMSAILPPHALSRTAVFTRSIYMSFVEFIFARLILSAILATLSYIFCIIIGIPYRSIIMPILLITDMIPFFGPILGASLCFVLVLLIDTPHAIFILLFIIAVRVLLSKFVAPRILRAKLRPSISATAISVLIGHSFLGVAGAMLSIPVYSTLSLSFRELQVHRLLHKGYRIEGNQLVYHHENEVPPTPAEEEPDTES